MKVRTNSALTHVLKYTLHFFWMDSRAENLITQLHLFVLFNINPPKLSPTPVVVRRMFTSELSDFV